MLPHFFAATTEDEDAWCLKRVLQIPWLNAGAVPEFQRVGVYLGPESGVHTAAFVSVLPDRSGNDREVLFMGRPYEPPPESL